MKTHKIIISTLALAMGAALAGSVSGTVAWFQYSTRAQAAYIGTSAHCSESLQVQAVAVGGTAVEANWKTELLSSDVAAALTSGGESPVSYGTALKPITTGAMTASQALPEAGFYSNPIYQHFALTEWEKATIANYAQFELHFRVKDIDGAETASYLAKSVYLTNLSIVSLNKTGTAAVSSDHDLYKAVRVHLSCGSTNLLFANDGTTTNTEVETSVSSNLDLNNDGQYDATPGYEWAPGTVTAYGTEGVQKANNVGKFAFTDDTDPTIPTAKVGSGLLGATTSSDVLKVTVTMWLEGWQKLDKAETGNKEDADGNTDASAVWNAASYIGQRFGVGFRFAVPAHLASE